MASARRYGPIEIGEWPNRLQTALQRLCKLQKETQNKLKIRTLDYPLTFGAFAIDSDTAGGVIYIEHYGYKTRRENSRTLALYRQDED